MNAVPQAVTLKDIADLMLKDHPGKRLLPVDVLQLPFFQSAENFLSRKEFSVHVKEAIQFMQVMDKEEVIRINQECDEASECLRQVRRGAAHAAVLRRSQKPIASEISTLSNAEARKVDRAEGLLQSFALLQRGLGAFYGSNRSGVNIADRKRNDVRRFAAIAPPAKSARGRDKAVPDMVNNPIRG